MNTADWLEFEVTVPAQPAGLRVRIGAFGERWVASVQGGGSSMDGLGATAREALRAALAPMGARTTTSVLAAPVMFAASAELIALQSDVPA
jgi:hypothetical protein